MQILAKVFRWLFGWLIDLLDKYFRLVLTFIVAAFILYYETQLSKLLGFSLQEHLLYWGNTLEGKIPREWINKSLLLTALSGGLKLLIIYVIVLIPARFVVFLGYRTFGTALDGLKWLGIWYIPGVRERVARSRMRAFLDAEANVLAIKPRQQSPAAFLAALREQVK
ncbi:MAG: hypothetical protein WAX89_05935 [Alphaproteobacteria bacterium]